MKKFNLATYAGEIASTLDIEPEVSRFYAELVPIKISPEEFWARSRLRDHSYLMTVSGLKLLLSLLCRLFFRIKLVQREGSVALDDDEEDEELLWEAEESKDDSPKIPSESGIPSTKVLNESGSESAVVAQLRSRNQVLESENARLQSHVKALVARISELEELLAKKQEAPTSSSANSDVPQIQSVPTSTFTDTSSLSSDGSAVLVNKGEESIPALPHPPSTIPTSQLAPLAPQQAQPLPPDSAASQSSSQLASLDEDEDDEWN